MEGQYKSLCYCTNLRRTAQTLSDYYDEALRETQLNVSQYCLMINLSRMGKANITWWAKKVGLDRSTMVRNVKVLENHGWVKVVEGNGKTFALSEEGKSVLDKAVPLWEKTQAKIEEKVGTKDAEAILRICNKLQEQLG